MRGTRQTVALFGLATLALGWRCAAGLAGEPMPATAEVIRAEALKPNQGEEGRPLPLAAHWHSRFATLDLQLEMIERGHHILPFTYVLSPRWANDEKRMEKHTKPAMQKAMQTLAAWKMPFVMITGGQWKGQFYSNPKFFNRPPEENPCVIDAQTGKPVRKYSPFGPVEAWRELGQHWSGTKYFAWLAEVYPDPPRVVCVSNNEAARLRDPKTSKRYMDMIEAGKKVSIGDCLYERHQAMIAGLHEAMPNEHWQKNAIIAAYNGGPGPDHMGREPGIGKWLGPDYKAGTEASRTERPPRNTWEGALPEAYDNHWEYDKFDHHVWSCQVEMMNLVFMKRRALQADPEWWMETIFWDGGGRKAKAYEEKGLLYPPERYAAWAQYVVWTLTPRVERQWNGSSDPIENWRPQWAALIRSVDLVHADPVLTRFWRKGALVPNPDGEHPFNHELPEKFKDEERWFHLSTNLDPPRPWTLTTRMPVFTLARVIGTKPKRAWLLYAHAPLGDREDVQVTIPDYQALTVDVGLEGSFYHLQEADGSVARVGDPAQLAYATNQVPEAKDDHYAMVAGETLCVTPFRYSGGRVVLANDADPDGDRIHAELVSGPETGDLSFRTDGSFTFRTAPDFQGSVSFIYRVHDRAGRSEPATVTIDVLGKPVRIVDDSFADFTARATPNHTGKLGYGEGITYFVANPADQPSSVAIWTVADLAPGAYEVFATWPAFSYQRPKRVEYTVNDGHTFRGRVGLSQEAPPEGPEMDGATWASLGRFRVESGSLRVELGNNAEGRWVIADALRVVSLDGGKARIVDDGDEDFRVQCGWNQSEEGFAGGSQWTRSRKPPKRKKGETDETAYDKAVWTCDGLAPGSYAVYATWPPKAGTRAVPYMLFDGTTRRHQARVSLGGAPRRLYAGGAWWNPLGIVKIESGTLRVTTTAKERHKTDFIADAIAVFRE